MDRPTGILWRAELQDNLAGRDPGSTWIQFNSGYGNPNGFFLFKTTDLTSSVIDQLLCSATPALTTAQFELSSNTAQIVSTEWRVPASGNHTLFAECGCVSFGTSGFSFVTAKRTLRAKPSAPLLLSAGLVGVTQRAMRGSHPRSSGYPFLDMRKSPRNCL